MADKTGNTRVVRKRCARSCAHKPLPPPPGGLASDAVTLLLFYQYIEPQWSKAQHKKALAFVIGLGTKLGLTGRGRCAAEGLNCTITGAPQAVRSFCVGLRQWNPVFLDTDFKLTDGLAAKEKFKALTIRKTDELVAYGLAGNDAERPSLSNNITKHVEAHKYHKMMGKKNTVIVDVRNAYESAIGHFQPPEGGAQLIDPKMRNSHEFPKWLNAPETQQQLTGKNVMMYCTGGIRCERASALLTQLAEVNPEFKPKKVVMVRGGIERYLKTYPEGGYWKGKNFLFDKRFEQVPELKSADALQKEVESVCCVCGVVCGEYRGQHKCWRKECKVPVIVCQACQESASSNPGQLQCPLCTEGHSLRDLAKPDLAAMGNAKRRAATSNNTGGPTQKKRKSSAGEPAERLFVGRLPLLIDSTQLRAGLGGTVLKIEWMTDKTSGLFYGSAFCLMASIADAQTAVKRAAAGEILIGGRKVRVSFAALRDGEVWPKHGHQELERPPVVS